MSSDQTVFTDRILADPWTQLNEEFDAWLSLGKRASLWWRDDDAVAPGPKLDQLIDVSSNAGLLLAVIPAHVERSLVSVISDAAQVQIAQHGYSHINHAERGRGLGAWELGMQRGEAAVMADLDKGRERLQDFFGSSFMQVIVPPWNRIAPELLQPIAARGYVGVSAFGARAFRYPVSGLLMVNAHCDPIRWKSEASFAGEAKTVGQLIEHLQARRVGLVDVDEPTGFLTHHIDLDSAGWDFCIKLANIVDSHAGARWISPQNIFEVES